MQSSPALRWSRSSSSADRSGWRTWCCTICPAPGNCATSTRWRTRPRCTTRTTSRRSRSSRSGASRSRSPMSRRTWCERSSRSRISAPTITAATINLDRALARRNVVLQAMRDNDAIDAATYQQAVRSRPRLADALRSEEAYGQYFKEEVRKQLVQRFGWDRVYQGGLKVYTTIDLEMQKSAEAEVARSVAEIEQRQLKRNPGAGRGPDPLQAALVAMDPMTGDVRAMVGGRSFDQSRFNRATQARRQAGSAFKPFVYAPALQQGFSPPMVITGLDNPIATLQGAWVPG